MTFQQIIEQIVADRYSILCVILILTTLVQIAPIKINPWGAIFGWIGRQLNKEVIEKIDTVEQRLDDHILESADAELRARRVDILDFSSSVLRGVNYHKEKFDFMMTECDNYETFCTENDIKNGVAEASIAEIRRVYREKLRANNFLSEVNEGKE